MSEHIFNLHLDREMWKKFLQTFTADQKPNEVLMKMIEERIEKVGLKVGDGEKGGRAEEE